MKCRHCAYEATIPMVDLGTAPPSNAYRRPEQLTEGEVYLPLAVFVCPNCWLAQTHDVAAAADYFTPDYAYFSAFSESWLRHSEAYVAMATERFALDGESKVVELASNDGYLLQYFVQRGIPCLGIEPTASTAAVARERGVPTVEEFFGASLARQLHAGGNAADLMIGNNVLAHVPDINDFLTGTAVLLKDNGVVTFEFPSLQNLIEKVQFDTVYHEHFSYLSLIALDRIFPANGLAIFDVERLPTHGGSLRVYAQRSAGSRPRSKAVEEILESERATGLDNAQTFEGFQKKAETAKNAFIAFLLDAQRQGRIVAAYGAAAKGNTFLNFAGVRSDLISFVVDGNPAKQGRFMPGSRIPILSPDVIAERRPDFLVLLPWNLREELTAQLAPVREWGGKLVVAIPLLEVF